jgi:hypothetical protein
VFGKDDGVLRADAAASRTAAFAVVLILDQDAVFAIDPVYAEETEINALQTIGASAVIDHRIPAVSLRLAQHGQTAGYLLRFQKSL